MKKIVTSAGCIAFLAVTAILSQGSALSSQTNSSVVIQSNNGNYQKSSSVVIQSDSGNYQKSSSIVIQSDSGNSHKISSVVIPSNDIIVEPDDFIIELEDSEDSSDISDSEDSYDFNESRDMNRTTSFTNQNSGFGEAFSYQQSSLQVSAANLNRPHLLSINTSGAQMTGEITVNGKVVKQLNNNSNVNIDLSRYLSVGEHTVAISARYAPSSSPISVELNGPGTSMTQQNSGNGVVNYTMKVSVH